MVQQLSKRVEEGPVRVKLPRGKQVLGEVVELLGASRFRIACKDGKERVCRMPGKFRRRIRVRVGDAVIIEPWDIEPDTKGDVVWIYNKTHCAWLKRKGIV